jgi:hypothetical protein
VHTVDSFIFVEFQIIFGHGNAENKPSDFLETVDPLLSLASLTAHIDHSELHVLDSKGNFRDTRGASPRTEDILIIREIIRMSDTVHGIKETRKRRNQNNKETVT